MTKRLVVKTGNSRTLFDMLHELGTCFAMQVADLKGNCRLREDHGNEEEVKSIIVELAALQSIRQSLEEMERGEYNALLP